MTIEKGMTVRHDGHFNGIALRVHEVRTGGMTDVVMVGDDQVHSVSTDELTVLDRDEYCGSCGQIGCAWD